MNSRTVLITGSSRGIGAEIATSLAEDGWKVILHYGIQSEPAKELAAEIGPACLGMIQADLMSPEETANLWTQASQLGQITALVNNAGIYIPCRFSADEAEWNEGRRKMMRVNFEAPCELMYKAQAAFLKQGSGKILNVASRVGFRGESGASFYAASKAALINMTRSLAVEYANTGIEYFGIAPGWVDTSMARDGMEDRLPEILTTIPMGRMASPADCAATVRFLLSDAASYLSGVVIDINGASYFH